MAFDASLWGRRVQLTGLNPTATLSGFVAVITLDNIPVESVDLGANSALVNGGDLRFATDDAGVNQLPLEIIEFVADATLGNRRCLLSVRIPTYDTGVTGVWMFYNKAAETQPVVTDPFGRNAVYVDREFQYNLYDVATISDSKGTTTPIVTGVFVDDIKTPFGSGVQSGSSTGYWIDLNENIADTTGDITLRAWVRAGVVGSAISNIILIRDGSGWAYQWRLETGTNGILIGGSSPNSGETQFIADDWYAVALTITGTTISFYTNGVLTNTGTVTGVRSLRPSANTHIFGNLTADTTGLDGAIADASVEFGAVPIAFIESEYSNRNDSAAFWTTRAPEDTNAATKTSNRWIANGSSYQTSATLGNLVTSVVRVVCEDVSWDTSVNGYLFSQAGGVSGNREFGFLASSGSLLLIAGGLSEIVLSAVEVSDFWGSALVTGSVEVEFDFNTDNYTIKSDNVIVKQGTKVSGTNRVDLMLWRFGARGTTDTGDTTGGFIAPSGTKIGNAQIWIDGTIVRDYIMPSTGTNIPELKSTSDGTLQFGTGGGADWEAGAAPGVTGTLASTLEDTTSAATGTVLAANQRYFSNLDGVAQYFIIPSYTGTITIDVYPLVDGTGLPTGAPAVTAYEWNTIAFGVTALTEVGKNGASFFTGLIANISGTALDVPVALISGVESPASLGATQSETILCEEIDTDWIEVANSWTSGDITTVDTQSGTTTQDDLTAGYQYYISALSDNDNLPWEKYLLQVGQHPIYSLQTGVFSNDARNYLTTANSNLLSFAVVDVTGGATTAIRVSRAFKQSLAANDYRFIFVSGQSLAIGGASQGTPAHRVPIDNSFTLLAMGADQPDVPDKVATTFDGLRDYTELNPNTSTSNWALLHNLNDNGITDKLILTSEGQSAASISSLAYTADSAGYAAQALDAMPAPVTSVSGDIVWIQGESDAATDPTSYKSSLRTIHDNHITNVGVHYPSVTSINMILDQLGGSEAYWDIAQALWDYSTENADAFLAMPKYHLNARWPATVTTNVNHLSAFGYDVQGEYIAKALHAVEYGGGTWRPLEPILAEGSGTEITITFFVPVGNLVADTTLVPAAAAHGITYERPAAGGTVTPSIVSVNSDNIVIDLGETVEAGGIIEFGHNATAAQGDTLPITNIRDQDATVGSVSGETLHNWLVLSSIELTISITGTLAETLENAISAASGVITTTGTLAETLEDAISAATGTIESTTTGTLQRHFISAGLWSSRAPFALLPNYAIGVPHPQNFFEYDPLTIARPSDPAEWPSAENSQFYYIDNLHVSATDTANTYGYPDLPRLTMPEGAFSAGVTMIVRGDGATYTITGDNRWGMVFTGSTALPCFLVGEGTTAPTFDKEIRITGSINLIVDGLEMIADHPRIGNSLSSGGYTCVRNCVLTGNGVDTGNGGALSASGIDDENRNEYVVHYNNTISFCGDAEKLDEDDFHAFSTGGYVSYAWYIGNTAHNNGGDSIQVGDQGFIGVDRPDHIYIAKNLFHDDGENAVDIKGAVDVIISENECYGYEISNLSSGEVIVIHDTNDYVWVINNVLYDGLNCISITAGSNYRVLGNECRDTNGTVDYVAPYFEQNTAIKITGAGPGHVAHNTIHNSVISSQFTGGSEGVGTTVEGNIFGEKQDVTPDEGWDFMIENGTDATDMSYDYNVYDAARNRVASTDSAGLSAWQTATSKEANSAEGDPLFANEASDDFTLQALSPALGIVAVENPAYAAFEARYGLSIRFDINGNAKPTTNADAGAYQRV